MPSALPARIPPTEATEQSPASIVDALGREVELPRTAIAFGTVYADAIEPDILAVLERARTEDLSWAEQRLLFRGLHILGVRRLTAAYRPLVGFLRGSQHRVEALLGDAVTETLPQIIAGIFDGDEGPLSALVTDATVDPFIRDAGLRALAFLTFDGRFERSAFELFLLRLDDPELIRSDEDVMWHGWMTAVAVVGLLSLVPRVRAAFADGRITPQWCDEGDFDRLLQAAIDRPHDVTRLEGEQMGYLDDALLALGRFERGYLFEKENGLFDEDLIDLWAANTPAHNPFRGLGRNDPCPCGSGKKYKKCCLG